MNSTNISINKTTAYNVISTFLVQGITFLTIPVFTRVMGKDQYGLYSVIFSWVILFAGVMDLGVSSTVGTGRYRFQVDYTEFRTNVLKLILGFGAVSTVVLFGISRIFPGIWGYSPLLMLSILLMALGRTVVTFTQTCLIYEKKAGRNVILSLILVGSTVTLSLLGVFLFEPSERYIGKFGGELIPYVCIAAAISLFLLIRHPAGWNREHIRFAVTVGLPIIFHELARNVLNQSDRVMMRWMDQPDGDIGIYSLFFSLASVLNVVLLALNNSWCPFYYDDLSEKNDESLRKKTRNYVELFSVLTVGFLLVSREVGYLMADDSYSEGRNLVPVFVIAIFCIFVYMFYVNAEFFYRKTVLVAVGSAMAAFINVGLNYLMIDRFGMYGAAIATTIAYGMLALFHYVCVRWILKLKAGLKWQYLIFGTVCLTLGVLAYYYLESWAVPRWGMAVAIGAFELIRIIRRKTIF